MQTQTIPSVKVKFGDQTVEVIKGGFYDRYQMKPNLDEIQNESNVIQDLKFFQSVPKEQIESRVGVSWSPNYYYRMESVQILFFAPIKQLRSKLPKPLEVLNPIPGYGIVALTFYRYDVCDIDPYNEVSIAIVCRQPGAKGSNLLELIKSIQKKTFHGYVLALPVTTEIARIRGVYGYQLPKWLMKIDLEINNDQIIASAKNQDGSTDLSFFAPTPNLKKVTTQSNQTTNISINKVDGIWKYIIVQLNPFRFAQRLFPRKAKVQYGKGRLSEILQEFKVSFVIRMDVAKEAQMALHLPKPLPAFESAKTC